jgi:hypothetical protein
MLYIYILCDPDTKMIRYVGQTNDPKERYHAHIIRPFNKKSESYNLYNYRWLRKIINSGKQPEMDILESGIETRDEANRLERFYIHYFQFLGFKLTNSSTADANEFSLETKKKMSLAKKGKTIEEIRGEEGGQIMREEKRQLFIENNPNKSNVPKVKEKISNTLKEFLKDKNNHWATGKTFSDEHLAKMKMSHSMKIIQYDMDMNIIKIWPSITSIAKDPIKPYRSESIINCCKDRISCYKGFIWKYANLELSKLYDQFPAFF